MPYGSDILGDEIGGRDLLTRGSLRLRRLSLPPGGLLIAGVPQFDQNMDLHLKDNDKIFFGDDDDTSLSFNATDTVLALSTGNFDITGGQVRITGGNLTLTGAGADFQFTSNSDHIVGNNGISKLVFTGSGSSPPSSVTFTYGGGVYLGPFIQVGATSGDATAVIRDSNARIAMVIEGGSGDERTIYSTSGAADTAQLTISDSSPEVTIANDALISGTLAVTHTDNATSGTITAQHNTLSFDPSGDSTANYDALLLEINPTYGFTDGYRGIMAALRTTYSISGSTFLEVIDDFRHIWINPPSGAVTGKITDLYGMYIGSPAASEATNHYGIYIEDLVGTGTNNPINQNGATGTNIFNAASTFAGIFKATGSGPHRINGRLNVGEDRDPAAAKILEVSGFTATNLTGLYMTPTLTEANDLALTGLDIQLRYNPQTAGSGNADNLGARFRVSSAPASTHNMRLVQGFEGSAEWLTTGTHTLTDLIGLKMRAIADGSTITTLRACAVTFEPSPDTAVTVTTGKGYEFDVIWDGSNAVTMTDLMGFHMKFTNSVPGGTSIDNMYGLKIDELPTGTNRFPIHQSGSTGTNIFNAASTFGASLLVTATASPGIHVTRSSDTAIMITQAAASDVAGGRLVMRQARGSIGSETATLSGDALGFVEYFGHTGSDYALTAWIVAEGTENWSLGNEGSALFFWTTPDTTGMAKKRITIDQDGGLGIYNGDEGATAKKTLRTAHETHTLAAATTSDTSIDIPSGALLLGASFNVDTAVSDDGGDDTWAAAYTGGSTTTLAAAGTAAAQNTKVDTMIVPEVASAQTNVRFTAQGGSFDGGVIEVVVYYEELTSLADA